MKIISMKPRPNRAVKPTAVEKLIAKYQRAGEAIRLRFIVNNPALCFSDGLIA